MSDPPRLMHENAGLGGRLLRSARADAAPSNARQRTLIALGLGAGATVTTGAAAGAGTAMSGGVAAKASLALLIAKLALGGAALTGITVAVVHHVRTTRATPPHAVARAIVEKSAPHQVPSAVAPRANEPLPVNTPSEANAPSAASPSTSAPEHRFASSARSVGSGGAASGGLADEVALLDGAREALAGGQVDRALSIVNQYEHGSSSKTLLLEAQVLRIEALVQRGDAARAAQLARAFLTQHPTSAHAARVRSLLLATEQRMAP